MSMVPMRYCPAPRCPNKVTKGYCPAHAVRQEQQRDNLEIRRLYRTARWRKGLRPQVLREQPFCPACAPKLVPATEVDHIRPHNENLELFWLRENLQGLCATHHAEKTRREERAAYSTRVGG
jgi:5-methylcytosine-specific restriction protein A